MVNGIKSTVQRAGVDSLDKDTVLLLHAEEITFVVLIGFIIETSHFCAFEMFGTGVGLAAVFGLGVEFAGWWAWTADREQFTMLIFAFVVIAAGGIIGIFEKAGFLAVVFAIFVG